MSNALKTVNVSSYTRKKKVRGRKTPSTSWTVRPNPVHVTKGDRVKFSTKTLLVLWFSKKNLFRTQLVTIPTAGKTLTVKTKKPGHYRYRVCCIKKGRFAYGSEPELIVP